MTRLVFAGLFDKLPGIKVITHHLGAMIPFLGERLDWGYRTLGSRTSDEDYSHILPGLKRPHAEYFKMFHADAAIFGSGPGTRCGVDYFGVGNVVFAPIAPAIKAIERLEVSGEDRKRLFSGNAERLMTR